VWTDDGVAVELFRVEDVFGETPDAAALEADLARAATARLAVDARLAERARTYARRAVAASHRAAPRVLVDEDASDRATVVEVRTPDGVAVLYRITKALAALGLDVRHAKVSTLGAEVVDSFYVVDATGAKLAPGRRDELQRSVLTALAPG
jgi:[protein-PII] uridylyltransferase